MVLLWTVLSCAVAVTAGAFLQPQLRLAAGAVADWGAYSLDLIASALENAADTCGHVTAAARHGIARGGWPVWPLIAAAIALAGAFFFVRGEFTLVESAAAALIAPDTLDANGDIVEAGPQNREMAESIAWVFVGGTVVLGGLPFVLARDDTDRIGPLARQTPGVRHTVTVAVLGLCVIAVLCSVALGMFRAEQSVGGREITTVAELAAYSAGGGTAAITSVGSLAVGWALDYVLMGVWLLFVAVSELALHIAALGARITADAAQRNARIVTPAAVDALGGSVPSRSARRPPSTGRPPRAVPGHRCPRPTNNGTTTRRTSRSGPGRSSPGAGDWSGSSRGRTNRGSRPSAASCSARTCESRRRRTSTSSSSSPGTARAPVRWAASHGRGAGRYGRPRRSTARTP